MLAASLLTFREGLEAALIVGIVLGYLARIGRRDGYPYVWWGVGLALAASAVMAAGLQFMGAEFQGRGEQIFEGTTMLLAVGVLTYMIFWMRQQARRVKGELEERVGAAVTSRARWGIFSVAFLAVFREGVETALFLSAATYVSSGRETMVGGVLGLALAVVAGWAVFASSRRLDIRAFFSATGALLIVFAAGLAAHGLHEFQEAGLLPALAEHVWNTKAILDDRSALGSVLRSLVGYNDDPSLLEVLGYLGYYLLVLLAMAWRKERPASFTS
ncbi:MAG: iron uptake transporter permease EfeU [Chloroflexota bacterium]